MRKTVLLTLTVLMAAVLIGGCGGGSSISPPPVNPTVALSFRDSPPAGVSVLSFEITVVSAVLQPGNVSLVNSPINVEIKKLETETAFLNLGGVAPGNYSSIQVTFSNPSLTFLNNSGATIGNCANGAVCQIKPTLNSSVVNFSGAPFPISVSANSLVGLVLDLDLNNSIQSNLSVTPTITVAQLPALQGTGQLEEIEFIGQVKSAGNNQFTIQAFFSGLTLAINVDGNTQFEDFGACQAGNISCLAVNQIVEVELGLTSGGALLAKEVELEANAQDQGIEGVITSRANLPTQFNMVVLDEEPGVNQVPMGSLVTVTLSPTASFSIAKKDLDTSGFSFASSADLLVGQEVLVRPVTVIQGPSAGAITITTDRVRLRFSQFTATVASVSDSNFTVNNLPPLFAAATPTPITQIQVNTSSKTEFEGVSGAGSLTAGATVSVEGLLFNTTSNPANPVPVLVAERVRKR
jgi:hypothetical protein